MIDVETKKKGWNILSENQFRITLSKIEKELRETGHIGDLKSVVENKKQKTTCSTNV